VFANHDWRQHVIASPLPKNLVAFHTRYKFLLQAHSESHYRQLGQIVAEAGVKPMQEILTQYIELFTSCLSQLAKINNHVNVMLHMLGFLKLKLSTKEKSSVIALIEQYKAKKVPLIVPVSMLNHYVEIHQVEYLLGQKYLSPYPYDLGLRNSL
jgi:uncharacterized protein YbgA (DUF1722 family)